MAKLARRLDLTFEERRVILVASLHPQKCTCATCRRWWQMLGPDPTTGNYGPFSAEEINGKTTSPTKPPSEEHNEAQG